jgi:hypothetical protein
LSVESDPSEFCEKLDVLSIFVNAVFQPATVARVRGSIEESCYRITNSGESRLRLEMTMLGSELSGRKC